MTRPRAILSAKKSRSHVADFCRGDVKKGGLILFFMVSFLTCGQDVNPPVILQLDRPQDVSFFCFGSQRLANGDEVSNQALPRSLCDAWLEDGVAPPGQEGISPIPDFFAVVLQASRGSAAVISVAEATSSPVTAVLDADPLTPGQNDIPIGTNPTEITGDESGCFAITTNKGSCDLSTLNLTSAVSSSVTSVTRKIEVVGGDGAPLLAVPTAIEVFNRETALDESCPEQATGVAYVAYPACDLVLGIDLVTGNAVGGIKFDADGTARIASEAEWVCSDECQDGIDSNAKGEIEPRALSLIENDDGGQNLLIGSRESSLMIDVSLDGAGLPSSLRELTFEGDIGFSQIKVTDPVSVGGDVGTSSLFFGPFRYIYGVASDGTVRVAEYESGVECDTQVDPRFLKDETDVVFLSCMPVGDPRTPPRRAGATSPGITLLSPATSVSFATIDTPVADVNEINPLVLFGTFAFITSANGTISIVNIDDDNYPDFEDPLEESLVTIPLAIAHQLRDSVADREVRDANSTCTDTVELPNLFGSRLSGETIIETTSQVSSSRALEMPRIRQTTCTQELDTTGSVARINELSYLAPDSFLESAFPDTFATQNETWRFTWEGTLSLDSTLTDIDGVRVREGIVDSENGTLFIDDPSQSMCATGVEVGDFVDILGCSGDQECGVGELCFFHPESTLATRNGLCVPKKQVDALADECRDFMVSRRTYRVELPSVGTLQLQPRASVLSTTPLDGCTSDQQCAEMADVRRRLNFSDHPSNVSLEEEPFFNYSCQPDPSLENSVDPVCVMTCGTNADGSVDVCDDGFICSDENVCVEGTVPSRLCLQSTQRYQIRGGNAFVVVGSVSGYQHQQIAEPESGICIKDPLGHPLLRGRIPLRPEPCIASANSLDNPNACSVELEDTELRVVYEEDNNLCALDEENTEIQTTQTDAIRFSNPQMTFNLVNSESVGDERCNRDKLGGLPPHRNFVEGFSVQFDVAGGFLPLTVTGVDIAFPTSIVNAPNGRLWVMDQGDLNSTTASQRGQVVTLDPDQATSNFDVTIVR